MLLKYMQSKIKEMKKFSKLFVFKCISQWEIISFFWIAGRHIKWCDVLILKYGNIH